MVDAEPHLYSYNVTVVPWAQGPSADMGSSCQRRTRRRCLFFDDFVVAVVVNVHFALLLPLSLLLSLLSSFSWLFTVI